MKQLSNEQRTRLEQIAKDEFNMRRSEIGYNKNKEYSDWVKAECASMEQSAAAKQYLKLVKELNKVKDKIQHQGFIITDSRNNKLTVRINTSDSYNMNEKVYIHPKNKEKIKKTETDHNAFTRGLNEVLAVIWSMEKPFSECISLIKSTVKAIK